MYDSSHVAAVSILLLGFGLVFGDWSFLAMGTGGSAFAFYILFALDEKRIIVPSFVSQLVLFAMGVAVLVAAYLGIQGVIGEANDSTPNMVIVILGFILMPLLAIGGAITTCCSLCSKQWSHDLLYYFATEPTRLKEKIF